MKVDVFTDKGKPTHLAIPNERHGDEMPSHRSVCGQDHGAMPVASVPDEGLSLPCKPCDDQLGMWRKVKATPQPED